jgi:glycosyltransferase involved in cell wall biosynthesis
MPPRSLARDTWRFVTVGSVTRRKGQHLLLEALAGVREDAWGGRSWSLELIGRIDPEPGYVEAIRELAVELGLSARISLGPRSEEDLLFELSRSHAHLFPSLDEGYGMAVYETLCAGIPTIFSESACALGPRYSSIPPLGQGGGVQSWRSAIELFVGQAELWEDRAASRRERPRSWDDTAAGIEGRLLELTAR